MQPSSSTSPDPSNDPVNLNNAKPLKTLETNLPNLSTIADNELYTTDLNKSLINLFLQDIAFEDSERFLADISFKKILLCKLASVSKSWRACKILKDDYISLKMCN